MGVVVNALTHMAIGAGNVVGVAIRLGHGEVGCPGPKPCMETATPIRGIQVLNAACVAPARPHVRLEGSNNIPAVGFGREWRP
jgi:hypothetical protein